MYIKNIVAISCIVCYRRCDVIMINVYSEKIIWLRYLFTTELIRLSYFWLLDNIIRLNLHFHIIVLNRIELT